MSYLAWLASYAVRENNPIKPQFPLGESDPTQFSSRVNFFLILKVL